MAIAICIAAYLMIGALVTYLGLRKATKSSCIFKMSLEDVLVCAFVIIGWLPIISVGFCHGVAKGIRTRKTVKKIMKTLKF